MNYFFISKVFAVSIFDHATWLDKNVFFSHCIQRKFHSISFKSSPLINRYYQNSKKKKKINDIRFTNSKTLDYIMFVCNVYKFQATVYQNTLIKLNCSLMISYLKIVSNMWKIFIVTGCIITNSFFIDE